MPAAAGAALAHMMTADRIRGRNGDDAGDALSQCNVVDSVVAHEALDVDAVVDPAMGLATVLAGADADRLPIHPRDEGIEALSAEQLAKLGLGVADRAARLIDRRSGAESGRASIVSHWTDTEGMLTPDRNSPCPELGRWMFAG